MSEHVDRIDKQRRWGATAATWARKAAMFLHHQSQHSVNKSHRWLIGYDASILLRHLLDACELLVFAIPSDHDFDEDLFDEIERDSRRLAKLIHNRRIAGKLSEVEGRTTEEAEAFLARAARLRDD